MKTIYAVVNKEGTISYVGCTKNIKNREYQHRAYNPETDHCEILEEAEDDVAPERESYWIQRAIDEGHPLKNRENKKKTKKWNNNPNREKDMRHGVIVSHNTYLALTKASQDRGVKSYFLLDKAFQEWCERNGAVYDPVA